MPSQIHKTNGKLSSRSRLKRGEAAADPVSRPRMAPGLAVCASIFFLTLVAYWPALRGGMLWDDDAHITSPTLQSVHGLWRIWFQLGATQQYYPLLHSVFWIEHRLWGDAVLGYHLANVIQHALSACLVVLIVRRLEVRGAWLAGCMFALHPVCVEAVAWISEQKSTLSAVFYLASALTYLHFDRSRKTSHYFSALLLFLLALLSKSVTATLPAVLLVIFWWKRGRLDWRREVRPLLPWFALGVTSGLFTAWVERTYIGASGSTYELTLVQHLLLAGRILCFYAGKVVWPVNLIFSYPHWEVDPRVWWQYFYPVVVLVVLTAFTYLATRRHGKAERGPLASLLIFAGTLFPVLGFLHVFPFKFSYVADHFQYLSTVAILVPAAYLLTTGAARISSSQGVSYGAGIGLIAVLGALTWQQSTLYADSETLYRATLARNPDSWMSHNNLGGVLSKIPGREQEAIAEYEAAVQLKPDYAIAHDSLGSLLQKQPGRMDDAIAEYRAAIAADPKYVQARNNLGIALALIPGGLNEAIAEFQEVLRIDPNYYKAHMNLGNVYRQMPGRMDDAIAEYQTTIRMQPDYVPAIMNLGATLVQMPGRLPDAIEEFEAAKRLQPDDAQVHQLLAYALAQAPGRSGDAAAEYETALRLQPNDPETRMNLGDVLERIPGRQQDALAQYQSALQLEPDSQRAKEGVARLSGQEAKP